MIQQYDQFLHTTKLRELDEDDYYDEYYGSESSSEYSDSDSDGDKP